MAEEIAVELGEPGSPATHVGNHTPRPQSLAGGSAGIALLHIERAFTQPEHRAVAHTWLSTAACDDLDGSPSSCLFYGVPALAFLTHAAAEATGGYQHAQADLATATRQVTRARLTAAHARIDRGERPALAEFDLIRGLTGLGAYLLLRSPDHRITRDVLIYLVRLTESLPGDDLPGWWTEHGPTGQAPTDYPGGHGNFGMAHGITGPLTLLALALRQGVAVPGHAEAIARICAWLDAWQQPHDAGSWWPRTITLAEARTGCCDQPGPAQPSWCYGTPGIVRALQVAALATHDTTRQHTAEAALLNCLNDPDQLARIIDPSLCHGAAGLLYTTWRVARDAATDELNNHLPMLATLLTDQLVTSQRNGELLEGSTGAALAIHAVVTDTRPSSQWDACLLLS
ncbi:lanthionine synthetase C family protein [Actinokineospora globicatena]|uniref:lanthionine synthetase C family protein n=1 Tax=Actinokineospora globicatena TaxID=103729 RepID=UPI0020A27EB5|nr:lanthionine synthetase C family protein [Actinokineospora globicatena]